jgi:predicted alpha-1,2-mannosidase
MNFKYGCLLILFLLISLSGIAQRPDLVKYVNPLSGTGNSTTASALKLGSLAESFANTIPAVCTPFAMTQWTPQTNAGEKKCQPPYYYKDDVFSGFRGSHWISGSCMQDYGSVTLMPIAGKLKTTGYAVKFTHADELSTPYIYRLDLPRYKLQTAITATPRCGMMEVTADVADSVYLLITPNSDLGEGYLKIDAKKGEIYGYNPVHRIYQGWGKPAGFSGYFVIKLEKAFATYGSFRANKTGDSTTGSNKSNNAVFVGFKLRKGEKLYINIGTSFSSLAGARSNLVAELSGRNFNDVVASCKKIWERSLQQIQVTTFNEKDKYIFYTSLYHAMQQPRLYNDVDGTYPQFSKNYKLAKITGGNYYDDFSLWDIYRAEVPLLEILKPGLVHDLVQSLMLKGEQGGWLPIFPCWNNYTSEMIGDHAISIITSAYLKGINTGRIQKAYQVTRKNAFEIPENYQDYIDGKGRRALTSYLQYGYIPMEDEVKDAFHQGEQVSRTLEYAYDDYALSLLANKLAKSADYEKLRKRSLNYKNVFNQATGFVMGRMKNGDWVKSFDPDKRESYITEGTPRQYTFYVPQDVPGLARLMGGRDKMEQALDSIYIKKQYWHGNEPDHQIPFMYDFTKSPWKTQKEVRKILADEYSAGPGGLGGNDDSGQMSSWYIFASIGFYPLNPVSGEYLLCSPIFDKVTINLPNSKKMRINCHKASQKSIYIHRVTWNGKAYFKNYITYNNLVHGGVMDIYMQDNPDKKWGEAPVQQPSGLVYSN